MQSFTSDSMLLSSLTWALSTSFCIFLNSVSFCICMKLSVRVVREFAMATCPPPKPSRAAWVCVWCCRAACACRIWSCCFACISLTAPCTWATVDPTAWKSRRDERTDSSSNASLPSRCSWTRASFSGSSATAAAPPISSIFF